MGSRKNPMTPLAVVLAGSAAGAAYARQQWRDR
jgi:hypothetical protein